jgi:hypothetical protein
MKLKEKNKGLTNIIKKYWFYIILRKDRYPLSGPSTPSFSPSRRLYEPEATFPSFLPRETLSSFHWGHAAHASRWQ